MFASVHGMHFETRMFIADLLLWIAFGLVLGVFTVRVLRARVQPRQEVALAIAGALVGGTFGYLFLPPGFERGLGASLALTGSVMFVLPDWLRCYRT